MRYGLLVLSIFVLSGCVSVPATPTPRFYSLQPMDKDEANRKFAVPAGVIIGFGPIKIPDYLNRPQIVTKNKEDMLKFAEFDRWGEGLNGALEHVMSENIAIMLPGALIKTYPWNSANRSVRTITPVISGR